MLEFEKQDCTTLACSEDRAELLLQQFSAVFTSEPSGPVPKPSAPDIIVHVPLNAGEEIAKKIESPGSHKSLWSRWNTPLVAETSE